MSMKPYYEQNGICIYHGDCREVLAGMPECSVDTVITDPPYGLGFMGKDWDHGVPGVHFWQEIARVAKPGAFLLAFGGTRTYHRLACAIEDAGWEIRDCMMWLYGSGFPKSLDISKAIDKAAGVEREIVGKRTDGRYAYGFTEQAKRAMGNIAHAEVQGFVGEMGVVTAPATDAARQWDGWGTALKPAWEPIIVAMKPLDGTFAENAQAHGVAGLNIDGGRIDLNGDYKCRANGRPSQTGLGDNYEPSKANQPDTVGRWPSNVLLDESAAAMLDEQSSAIQSGKGKYIRRHGAKQFLGSMGDARIDPPNGITDSGGASRFFKVCRNDCGCFLCDMPVADGNDQDAAIRFQYSAKASRSERESHNNHPTVKPLDLMEYLCKLTATPTGGVVLDPFAGSGTTLLAARKWGRPSIGIELNESYCEIARKRLAQGVLFGPAKKGAR